MARPAIAFNNTPTINNIMEIFMQRPVCGPTAKNAARALQQKRYHADDKRSKARRDADFARRQHAAGLDRDRGNEEDMDAYRLALARHICMFVNDWEGCPLRLCQRMQGCMAPQSACANNADDPPMTREEWDAVRLDVRRAIDAEIEARGGLDAVEAAAEAEAHSADKSHQKS